ncbi:MAG TPA: hypothetical protein VGR95_06085 [Thermoanaerobaculia bacterium]|nr:hypothetical protein [Thermoanaerobaculia bacterium]
MSRSSVAASLAVFVLAPSLFAATFVVPTDRDLVRRAHGIVIATAMASYSQPGTDAAIETVTPMQIEETIKGRFASTINVVEPGGTYGGVSMVLTGVPQFEPGQRMLLFLANTGKDRWAVTELVLGKFSFVTDETGQELLVRDEDEIVGWDPNLQPHVEGRRSAEGFLQFVRTEVSGGMAATDYFVSSEAPLQTTSSTGSRNGAIQPSLMATYSATSYTMIVSGSMGSRWTVFPSAVNWYVGQTTEPGAPNGGITAAQTGIASWDNDCPSNVNYVYGGIDNGTHTQGLHAPDGANTILFERDLSTWGVSPFSCSSGGYSGTLGIGGVTSASGTNFLGSETFVTTQEADVEMNRGIANCTLLFNNGDFNSAVTHELGHTLGFRHSDQNRPGNAACSTDPSLECSSSAIMTAFVTSGLNAALTAWDQHAVDALYPGGSCSTCTPPSITSQPQSKTISAGTSTTLTVAATGTAPLSYQWYYGTSGNTGSPIQGATGTSITVGGTYSYWVRVSNACGSVNSVTATVTVSSSSCTPPTITSQPQSKTIPQGTSTTLTVAATGTAPLSYQWYYGTSGNTGSPIQGATGTSITVGGTYSYWVRVSNACGSVDSVTATVTVSSSSCTPPTITSQPQSQTIPQGTSTTLTVAATGTAPLSYQWYYGTSGNTGSPIQGATGTSITVGGTYSYWVRVSNACGSVNSVTATVTVSSSSCTPPTITSQPQSQTIPAGSATTLSVAATGTATLNYQWYYGTSGNTASPIQGATGTSIYVGGTYSYWVRVSNGCGSANSVTATVTAR